MGLDTFFFTEIENTCWYINFVNIEKLSRVCYYPYIFQVLMQNRCIYIS